MPKGKLPVLRGSPGDDTSNAPSGRTICIGGRATVSGRARESMVLHPASMTPHQATLVAATGTL